MRGIQNTAVGLETVMTTENPSRNVADVLAQELSGIATALTTASNTKLHLFNKLWENPSPSSGFAGQTILLDLSGYDFIYVVVSAETIVIPINGNTYRIQRIAGATSAPYHAPHVRDVSATSTGVSFGNGLILNVSGGSTDNTVLVPAVIYGFKKTYDINAIVSSINTDADRCMMSDGVTSVEQEITALDTDVTTLKKSNLQTRIAIDAYSSSSNLYTFPYDGYVEMLPSDNTKTGTIFVFGSKSNSVSRCAHIESNGTYISLYVRKNMRCYCTGTANHYFIPIQ